MSDVHDPITEPERLLELSRCLNDQDGFSDVVAALAAGEAATLDGVWGSSCALVVAELIRGQSAVHVVVCPQPNDVEDFCDDLALFCKDTPEPFPSWESDPGERILHDETYGDRLRLLKLLAHGEFPTLVVTSIQSLLQPVPSRAAVDSGTRTLKTGERIDTESFLRWMAEHGFHHTSAVELPGEFSARGGIIDVFAPDWYQPVRIELFDDEVTSIRRFDVSSQRSLKSLDSVEVTVLTPSDQDREYFSAYLPEKTRVLFVEPEQLREQGNRYLEHLEHSEDFHNVESALAHIAQFPTISASALSTGAIGTSCHLAIESVQRFTGDIVKVRDELDRLATLNEVLVICQTEAESHRLKDIFNMTQLAVQGKLRFHVGQLSGGFQLVRDGIVLISGNELFNRTDLKRLPARRLGKTIDSFLDLREGDLVVHLAHGIGRYRGLKLLEKERLVEEHLEIEFHGRTKVYVPSSKIDLVQKYVGSTKSRPGLAKLGGKTWVRQKQAAEQSVTDLAAEMLELQAARASRPGIAFDSDSSWQREFDALFPYQETPDQTSISGAIRTDMTKPRPMDRLLCGDVGFGKTELAMRAAFAAIDNGYQVAVLVPTTILAEQHYRTFSERMSEFPCVIAKLSRFCSTREQRHVLEGLAEGRIDAVVGTHRLASRDVTFQNLGLLIIDEEQRFGVEVKERLKSLRTTVDVLTMTATPIPRTLHMSLVGVRDISNLETPPEDRISVETRATRFDPELIRHAVLRELNRGGQVFFVHNRVNDIEIIAKRLRQIVPEANLRIGHGQMPEAELERVMVDFVDGRFDLLVATTIIESGLDIPNANTIFIDEADRYGLSDLHQLRGRVGRYKHRAYCYLLIDARKSLTPNAARRLRAIEEFSNLGSGFAIAMRDLEIRGAGNILGTQQSGHISAVGYELYCQLLENAVRSLKQLPAQIQIDVTIDLPGRAYIPSEYVGDMRLKIDLYRRIARVATDDDLDRMRSEMNDRFGPLPAPVKRLLSLAELRIDSAMWQVHTVQLEDKYLVFRYSDRPRIEQLAARHGRKMRIVDDSSVYWPLADELDDPDRIITKAQKILRAGPIKPAR